MLISEDTGQDFTGKDREYIGDNYMGVDILKPGQIGVSLFTGFEPVAFFNVMAQGDTRAKHVWMVLPNGKIATTGADKFVMYGEVDPKEYLKNKTYYLLETIDPLPQDKLDNIQKIHDQIMQSKINRFYGFWKIPEMLFVEMFKGEVDQFGNEDPNALPKFPICSQAVAYILWQTGIPIGKALGKIDYSAVTPRVILQEAEYDSAQIDSLLLGKRPCYYLRLVGNTFFTGFPV